MEVNALAAEIGEVNAANGWREPMNPQVAEYLAMHMLIVTEVAELSEEIRNGRAVDEVYYSGGVAPGRLVMEPSNKARDYHGDLRKPEGVPAELADIVIRCLDFADKYGIDLESAIAEKLDFNRSRGYRHGGKTI